MNTSTNVSGQVILSDEAVNDTPKPTDAIGRIAKAWPALPPHVREAIFTLIDSAVERRACEQ
jgi:hypothetical protein